MRLCVGSTYSPVAVPSCDRVRKKALAAALFVTLDAASELERWRWAIERSVEDVLLDGLYWSSSLLVDSSSSVRMSGSMPGG